jgi:hypothetical protein
MEDRELYDIRSASRRVHRSRWTIYHWMRAGMTFRMIGGRRYITHTDLLAALRLHSKNERLHQFKKKVSSST